MGEVGVPRLTQWSFPSFWVAVLWTLLVLVVQVGVSIVAAVAWLVVTGQPVGEGLDFLMLLLATSSTATLALAVTLLVFRSRWSGVVGWRGCSLLHWLAVLALVLPFAVVASEFTNWMELLVSQIEPEWLHTFRMTGRTGILALADLAWWWALLIGCLLPAFGEELYWRGFLSRGLVRRYGVVLGTVWASLLFGAVHLLPVQACGAFLLGIGMQIVFLSTRSLLAAMTLHGLNNAFAFGLVKYKAVISIEGLTAMPAGEVVHTSAPLLAAALLATASLLAVLILSRSYWRLPDGSVWDPGYLTAERPDLDAAAQLERRPVAWPWIACAGASLAAFAVALAMAIERPPLAAPPLTSPAVGGVQGPVDGIEDLG